MRQRQTIAVANKQIHVGGPGGLRKSAAVSVVAAAAGAMSSPSMNIGPAAATMPPRRGFQGRAVVVT